MPRNIGALLCAVAMAGCGSTSGAGGPGQGPTSPSGWNMVVSSGSQLLHDVGFTGGVTDGQVSGAWGLHFRTATEGWSVGNLGEIFRTTDGGASAHAVPPPTSGTLYGVFAPAAGEVWIVGKDTVNGGASIWSSTNGGATWVLHVNTADILPNRTDTYADRLQRVVVGPSGEVAAVGRLGNGAYVVLLRDAVGSWWELDDWATGTNDALFGLAVVASDPQRLVAVGNGGLVLTTGTGGATWTHRTSGTAQPLYKVACQRAGQVCIAAGGGGVALRSTDGGASWTSLATGTVNDLAAVAFSPDGGSVWIGGDDGTILRSTDLGATWHAQTTHTVYPIRELFMTSDQVGWAAASYTATDAGGLLTTSTGGAG